MAATRIIARTTAAGAALDSSSSLGQQLNLAASGPFSYYFASGDIMLTNEEYLTILNPNSAAAAITVTVLPQSVVSSTTAPTVAPITLSIPANSRLTEPIRKDLAGQGLLAVRCGAVQQTAGGGRAGGILWRRHWVGQVRRDDQAGGRGDRICSRSLRRTRGPGRARAARPGTGKDVSEVDIVNPAPATTSGSATVTVSFLDESGDPINSQQVQVDPSTRETVAVNDVVRTQAGRVLHDRHLGHGRCT